MKILKNSYSFSVPAKSLIFALNKRSMCAKKKEEKRLSFEHDIILQEETRFKLKPEDVVKYREDNNSLPADFNPYGDYEVRLPKFLGDEPPCEQFHEEGYKLWEVINDGDPNLTPVHFSMPEPPKDKTLIANYGLPQDEQYFRRIEIPRNFKLIEQKALQDLAEIEKKNRQDTIQGYKYFIRYWEIMEEEMDNIEEDLQWLKNIWWYRTYGYWFYNDGELTFIPPDYFDFLNFYYIQEAVCYPEYRHDVRRKYCYSWYLENCTETFKHLDSSGRAKKNVEGKYEMIDLGRRVFYGDAEPKTRRTGATHEALHKLLKGAMTHQSYFATIISFEGDSASSYYRDKLLPAFDEYPMCIKPMWEGNRRPKTLRLDAPANVYMIRGLKSSITYSDSAGLFKNDGKRLNGVLNDEQGKCYGIDTEIIMSDGTIKKVQDIRDGEYVMGDDGEPRLVYGSIKGFGKLYRVDNKFGSFICNEDHILSLKTSMKTLKGSKNIGDVINFPIKDILKWHPQSIRNTKLYRASIKYAHKDIPIDPYILGVWLGDGSYEHPTITNIDKEVIDAIIQYTQDQNFTYHTWDITHSISNKNKEKKSFFSMIKDLGLYKNKHIPDIYLKNSRDVRLGLLAGLIDTDGSRDKREKSRVYDIVQKRKHLAEQICQLANSLGFWSRIENKVATMKRDDGSVYRCDVYRVKIYGDLHLIPVKVNRKKYIKPTWWTNRNPNHSWYKITPIGDGDYYGFAVSGNHLFMLANQIVVHNSIMSTADIFERWHVNKYTMSTGMGVNILKGAYVKNPSTVENMGASSPPYKKMCDLSNFYVRIPTLGQTIEGFARMFLPAYLRLEGYIDRFGKSVIEKPTERQMRLRPDAMFATSKKGAREVMQEERDALLNMNSPESMERYRSTRRKSPFEWAECWLGSAGNAGYNLEIIDKRLSELNQMKSFDKMPYRVGYFYREHNNPQGSVLWTDDKDKAKFRLSMMLPTQMTNQREMIEVWDGLSNKFVPSWKPINGHRFTLGCDPFRNLKATDVRAMTKAGTRSSNSRQSDGGIAVLWEYDASIDGNKPKKEWDSFKCVCSYRYRPPSQEEFFDDVVMCAQYFGAMIFPEQNVEAFLVYMYKNGYGGYGLHESDIMSGKLKPLPGRYNATDTNQDMVREIKDYIEFRGHIEDHDDLLAEIKSFQGVEDFTRLDLKTAFGMALLGSKSRHREIISMGDSDALAIDDIF